MSEAQEQDRLGIGGNRPPVLNNELLPVDLRQSHQELTARRDELIAGLENVPTEVFDDETSGRIGDYIKQLDGCMKQAEAFRVGEKAPFLEGGRIVDGFFHEISDSLKTIRDTCAKRDAPYKAEKAEKERQARLESDRLAREKADRLRAEADERARVAREAAERAIREKEEAEAALKAEQEARELERQEAERKAREEEERIAREAAEAAKAAEDEEERKRIEAEQAERNVQARIKEAADTAAREAREKEEAKQRAADEKVRAARQKADEREAARAKREADANAKRAEAEAVKTSRAAGAGTAELSRTRGEHGSVGGIRDIWIHDENSLDRLKIDLEALRHHLPVDGIHKAIRSFIRAGGRKLRGVHILEDNQTTYR